MAQLITTQFIQQNLELSINVQLAFRALDAVIGEHSTNKFAMNVSEDIADYLSTNVQGIDWIMEALRQVNVGELSFSDFLISAFVWSDTDRGFNYYQLVCDILRNNGH